MASTVPTIDDLNRRLHSFDRLVRIEAKLDSLLLLLAEAEEEEDPTTTLDGGMAGGERDQTQSLG